MYYFLATTVDVGTQMGNALQGVQESALSTIGTVAPYGIAIMGAFLVWRYGLRFFKSIAK